MEFWKLFGNNIGLSLAGLIGYGFFLYGRNLKGNELKPFLKKNFHFIIWALGVQLLYSLVLAGFPVLEHAVAKWMIGIIKAAVPGLDFEIPEDNLVTVVYLLGGWLLSLWAKERTKKEITN